jgi:hypothetical protein
VAFTPKTIRMEELVLSRVETTDCVGRDGLIPKVTAQPLGSRRRLSPHLFPSSLGFIAVGESSDCGRYSAWKTGDFHLFHHLHFSMRSGAKQSGPPFLYVSKHSSRFVVENAESENQIKYDARYASFGPKYNTKYLPTLLYSI